MYCPKSFLIVLTRPVKYYLYIKLLVFKQIFVLYPKVWLPSLVTARNCMFLVI